MSVHDIPMSAYVNDPRVTFGDVAVEVLRPGVLKGVVQPAQGGGFASVVQGPVFTQRVFDTADEAIRSLIGDPR